jgi:predicted enzyme related to lactoylglutathione lyase
MKTELGRVVILVNDYDEAFKFYKENFGCKKFFDLNDETGQRFLHICFDSESPGGLWFLEASTEEEKKRVGNQTGGQPVFVLYTDSIDEQIENLNRNGVKITRGPEITEEFISMSMLDLYGNEIVIVQQK